jgi:hypothetical protein
MERIMMKEIMIKKKMMKNQEGNMIQAKKKKINLMVAIMTMQNPTNRLCVVQTKTS